MKMILRTILKVFSLAIHGRMTSPTYSSHSMVFGRGGFVICEGNSHE